MQKRIALLSVIACGIWSAPAVAQNALGAGNALDANTGSAYNGLNLPATAPDFRNRNLIVTRDVAAGRGFRGTVGYTAEYDFRGVLGSNDLYAERANAALSSPLFVAAGRTMERMRFGQYLSAIEYRRAGRGSALPGVGQEQFIPQPAIDDRLNLDQFALSSTSSAIYQSQADGRIIGLLQDTDGQRSVAAASSLFGVQVIPAQAYGQAIGLNSYDMARAIDDVESGRQSRKLGDPFQVNFEDLGPAAGKTESRPESGLAQSNRVLPPVVSAVMPSYREILERIEKRYAAAQPKPAEEGEGGLLAPLDEQFDQLRDLLGQAAPPEVPGPGETDEASQAEPAKPAPDLDALSVPLRHGVHIDQLTAGDQGRFQELVASGEQKLREGEYFWAERRFERALRFTPGHPLATAGLGHAQIGAGLYAPAALTLRRLLIEHPEMIDVRYGPEVLPSRVRLDIAVDRLHQLVKEQRDRGLHAFLLAYIGHQLDERDLVEEGLNIMRQTQPDDPLRALLESVWLGDK